MRLRLWLWLQGPRPSQSLDVIFDVTKVFVLPNTDADEPTNNFALVSHPQTESSKDDQHAPPQMNMSWSRVQPQLEVDLVVALGMDLLEYPFCSCVLSATSAHNLPRPTLVVCNLMEQVIGECHSGQIGDEVDANGGFPPGLLVAQVNHVMGKQQLQSNGILLRKLGILNVIQAMELAPELAYPLYIAASVD
ncbi:hypothetical protein JHK84_040316 [Glycine max]|nr:hypothetical protein JHK84_040316 [Glycine max]